MEAESKVNLTRWRRLEEDVKEWTDCESQTPELERVKGAIKEGMEGAILSADEVNDCLSFFSVIPPILGKYSSKEGKTDGNEELCYLLIQLFFTILDANQEKKL